MNRRSILKGLIGSVSALFAGGAAAANPLDLSELSYSIDDLHRWNKKAADWQKSAEKLQQMIDVQLTDGNWNYDPYMHGLANGLIAAKSNFEDKQPVFIDAPDKWLSDSNVKNAFAVLEKEISADTEAGSYAHSWHCNIAMAAYDSMRSADVPFKHEDVHRIANEAASRFMRTCFDVETRG